MGYIIKWIIFYKKIKPKTILMEIFRLQNKAAIIKVKTKSNLFNSLILISPFKIIIPINPSYL